MPAAALRRLVVLGCPFFCFSLLLLSCHDSPRKNPFDPELTPAVELTVALDDTAGTATLTWTPYAGEQPFAEYRVLRSVLDRSEVDTLKVITDVELTTLIDTSLAPNTGYVYLVLVVNTDGFEAASQQQSTSGYQIGPVELLEVKVDRQEGGAALRWMRFTGGRFEAYRVERRGARGEFVAIGRVAAVGDTSFTDADLAAGVSYVYRIVVEAAGLAWTGTRSDQEEFSFAEVELLAAQVDSISGDIHLTWTRFTGLDFQTYQVRRRVADMDEEVILVEYSSQTDTVFVDRNVWANVDYRYTVAVLAAGQEQFSNTREGRLHLLPVQLEDPEFDSATASVTLRWAPYAGPRFQKYRVLRSAVGLPFQMVAEVEDRSAATFIDTGLKGNAEYVYQIGVVIAQEEETYTLVGESVGGAIHPLVATWPLEIDERDHARLFIEEGRLTILATTGTDSFSFRGEINKNTDWTVRLLVFDGEGGLLEERILYQDVMNTMIPQAAATFASSDGGRFLSLAKIDNLCKPRRAIEVLNFGPDGEYRWFPEKMLLADVFSEQIGEGAVDEIVLVGGYMGGAFFDNVVVSSGGQVLFTEDFEDESMEDWETVRTPGETEGLFLRAKVEEGRGFVQGMEWTHEIDATWQDIRVQADVGIGRPAGQVAIGLGRQIGGRNRDVFRTGTLWLTNCNEALLLWNNMGRYEEGFGVFQGKGTPFRLALEIVDGQLSASVRSPLWFDMIETRTLQWTSLVSLGGTVLLSADKQLYSIATEEDRVLHEVLGSPVSEMRLWERPETYPESGHWLGVCLPEENLVLTGGLQGERLAWPFTDESKNIGAGEGPDPGHFLFPLSLDAGPDQRIYVLDAGNARIQVFDIDGNYITHFGRMGSAAGEFDFGSGGSASSFAGSIAVDDDGYIYVADVGNRRIQKFAP